MIPAIVNLVYKKLLRHDITARIFSSRDSRATVDPETWVTEDSAQIQHRKLFLRWYLTKLNGDPTKMEYWEYLDKVGLMHVGLGGRRKALHVDYVFLGACLGYIQDAMTEAILSHPTLELERKIAIVRAVGKVIWIQNDLLARWHVVDGEEYGLLDGTEEAGAEGQLGGDELLRERGSEQGLVGEDGVSTRSGSSGKTSLGRDVDEVEPRMSVAGQSRCPFSGVVLEHQRAEPVRVSRADSSRKHVPPSGIPRLYVVDGKTVCKEKLDPNPFESDIGRAV